MNEQQKDNMLQSLDGLFNEHFTRYEAAYNKAEAKRQRKNAKHLNNLNQQTRV